MYFSSKNQPITLTDVHNFQNQNDLNGENETKLLSVNKYEFIPIKDFYDNETKEWSNSQIEILFLEIIAI